jgi:hypothetical protein
LARRKGTYDSILKAKAEQVIRSNMKVGIVIDIEQNEDASERSRNISPVTMKSLSSSSNVTCTSTTTGASTSISTIVAQVFSKSSGTVGPFFDYESSVH